MHVDHLGGDDIHPREILEAAEHDAMRRRPEQAADDLAAVLDHDERGIEPVEARLDAEPPEQPEREVVLRLACSEERPDEREERVGVVDADRAHRQGAASRWPPSTGRTIPVTNAVRQQEPDRRGRSLGRTDASGGERAGEPVEHRRRDPRRPSRPRWASR